MGTKPLTVMRQEYLQQVVDAINACPLPAVFKADVLENALRQLRELAEKELQRDMESYQADTLVGEVMADQAPDAP